MKNREEECDGFRETKLILMPLKPPELKTTLKIPSKHHWILTLHQRRSCQEISLF